MKIVSCPMCNSTSLSVTEYIATITIDCMQCRTSCSAGDEGHAEHVWNDTPRLFDYVGTVSIGSPYLPMTVGGIRIAVESLENPIPHPGRKLLESAEDEANLANAAFLGRFALYFATLPAASILEIATSLFSLHNSGKFFATAEDQRQGLGHSLWLRSELLKRDLCPRLRSLGFKVDKVNFMIGRYQEMLKWQSVDDPF